jgi:hypothetical protein
MSSIAAAPKTIATAETAAAMAMKTATFRDMRMLLALANAEERSPPDFPENFREPAIIQLRRLLGEQQ